MPVTRAVLAVSHRGDGHRRNSDYHSARVGVTDDGSHPDVCEWVTGAVLS